MTSLSGPVNVFVFSFFTLKKCFPSVFHCLSMQRFVSKQLIWIPPRSMTCGPSGLCWSELTTRQATDFLHASECCPLTAAGLVATRRRHRTAAHT